MNSTKSNNIHEILNDFIATVKKEFGFIIDYDNIFIYNDSVIFTTVFSDSQLEKLLDLLEVKIKHGFKNLYFAHLNCVKIQKEKNCYISTVSAYVDSHNFSYYDDYKHERIQKYFYKLDRLISHKINQLKNKLCEQLLDNLRKEGAL